MAVTEVELERTFRRELERIRAISDPEGRFEQAQLLLRLISEYNPLIAEVRGSASLGLKAQGWTHDEIGERFVLKKSSVQRIVDTALGRPQRPRKRRAANAERPTPSGRASDADGGSAG